MRAPKGRQHRAVLVIPRHGPEAEKRLAITLDNLGEVGWTVSAVIDPAQHLDALRMVIDGVVDTIVALEAEHLPSVTLAVDLNDAVHGRPGRRTQRMPRPDMAPHTDRVERPAEVSQVGHLPETVTGERRTSASVGRRQIQRGRTLRRTA